MPSEDYAVELARLAQEATQGSESASGQLEVLGGAGADLSPWLTAAAVRRHGGYPRIAESQGFLPPAACAWLIGRARGRLTRAQVFTPGKAELVDDEGRSNRSFPFYPPDLDLVIRLTRAKIAATVGVPVGCLETTQVLHYAPGQMFAPHYDVLHPEGQAEEIARLGQRRATFLVYLNEGYEGGETDFPLLGIGCKGRTGDALLFANLDAEGRPDEKMLHAGMPPTSGEKWLLSQWVRDREAPDPG